MIIIDQLVWDGPEGHKVWAVHDDEKVEWSYCNAAVWQKPNGDLIFVHYHKQDYATSGEELRFCQFSYHVVPDDMLVGQEIDFDTTPLLNMRLHKIDTGAYRAIYRYLSEKWTVDHAEGGEWANGERREE
jgi:hypothetical protein